MVKTIVFVIILIIIILFSLQTKFIAETRNLYRYGPQVDLRTLTQFQWPWPTFQGHRPSFVPKTRNFKSTQLRHLWSDFDETWYEWTTIRCHVGDLLFDDLDLLLQVKLEIGPKFFVTGLAKSGHRRIILATRLDGYYQGPLRIEVWWRLIKYSLKY